jgi:DNA primase
MENRNSYIDEITTAKVNEIDVLIESLVAEKWGDKVKIKNNKTRCPKCGTGKKDTSFSINPDGGYAHCFDCGGSWKNILSVMIFRDCDWKEAIEYLADRAGLEHPNWNKVDPEEEKRRNEIREKQEIIRKLYTLAAEFYHHVLMSVMVKDEETGEEKRKYQDIYDYLIKDRGWTEETIRKQKIGFCPDTNPSITLKVFQDKLPEFSNQFLSTGIIKQEDQGDKTVYKDHLRGRIIYPYLKGDNVIYMKGRSTSYTPSPPQGDPPKYLAPPKNLPQDKYDPNKPWEFWKILISPYIDHGAFMGEDIPNSGKEVVVTEGAPDYISARQEGLNVVSPVTVRFKENARPRLLALVKGYDCVFIINDNEESEAGKRGALETGEFLMKHNLNVLIVDLPLPSGFDKVDLNEYFARDGGTLQDLKEIMKKAKSPLDIRIEQLPSGNWTQAKAPLQKSIIPVIAARDDADKTRYLNKVKNQIGKDEVDIPTLRKMIEQYEEDSKKTPIEKGEVEEFEPEVRQKALELLKMPELLRTFINYVNRLGVVGERRNIAMNLLAFHSRILNYDVDEPTTIWLKNVGGAGGGKSVVQKKVSKLFPDSVQFKLQSISEQAMNYLPTDAIKNKCIVKDEGVEFEKTRDGNESNFSSMMRQLNSEGYLKRNVTTADETTGEMVTKEYKMPGPSSMVVTSTEINFGPQIDDRFFPVHPNTNPHQTNFISLLRHLKNIDVFQPIDDKIINIFKCLSTLLETTDKKPLHPFELDNAIKTATMGIEDKPLSFRRAEHRFYSAIDTITSLYQHQRKRDEDGRLIVEPADYHMAYQVCFQTFQESVGDMSEPEKAVYEIIRKKNKSEFQEIYNDWGAGSKDSLYKHIRSLKEKGYVNWVDVDDMIVDPKQLRSLKKYLKISGKPAENVNYFPSISEIVDDPDWKEDGELFKKYDLKLDDDGMEILLECCRSEIADKIIVEHLDDFNKLLATCGYKIVSNHAVADFWEFEKLGDPQYSRKTGKKIEHPTFYGDEIKEIDKFLVSYEEFKELLNYSVTDFEEQVGEDPDDTPGKTMDDFFSGFSAVDTF